MAHTNEELRDQVTQAVAILKGGGVILYPTDTVWGLGCDATNAAAVDKINGIKGSEGKTGMIVLVESADQASRYTNNVPPVAWDLVEMADKPLTLILPGGSGVAESLIGTDGSLAIRIPHHDFCGALLRAFRKPIVSTSANLTGKPAPARFSEISADITGAADLVIDPRFEAGATGKPSSIVALGEGGQVNIIRE